MKKIYISICALAVSFSTIAQETDFSLTEAKGKKSNKVQMHDAAKSTPFWSEDFANGIPTTWTNAATPWEYRGTGTTPSNSVGSQGAYASAGTPIASPTASNGFMIFDSDYYDNAGNAGAFGTGQYPTPHNGELMTDMIDLSLYTDVTLNMNSYYRTYAGQAFVDFYINGVFDSRVQVHSNISVNDATATDEVTSIRVPFSVVGNADVQMSFVFEGTTNTVNGFSGYYFWQIDDLELVETPENKINIENVVIGGFWIDYANYTGNGNNSMVGLDYTVTPLSQLNNHPYSIEGIIRNYGSADQNSVLKYETFGAGVYSGSSSSTVVSAASLTNTIDSTIVTTVPLLSPALGKYGVAVWSESDSAGNIVAVSDTVYKPIEITDYIYGKDLGDSNPGSYILGGVEDQNHITTRYEMYADEQLTGLRVYISDRSHVGAEIKAIIYELDTTASNGVVFLDESDNYSITAQDLGAWVDIPFLSPISLFDGYAYEFGVVGFQHPSDSSYVGVSGTSLYNGEHSLFDELGLSTQSAGTPTWYYITSTPMVRMSFAPPSSVNDVKESIFAIYPNPSKGIFNIDLDKYAEYDVAVSNSIGQVVLNTQTSGLKTSIDLSSFSKGVYMVELKNNVSTYTEKLIIE